MNYKYRETLLSVLETGEWQGPPKAIIENVSKIVENRIDETVKLQKVFHDTREKN